MNSRDNVVKPSLGKITDNDWKEEDSVSIAEEQFKKGHKILTYFARQDKRPNLDGSLSIVENQEEIITVEVQIKTLPKEYYYKRQDYFQYRYECDTKIFNVVRRQTTLNPVALILVDIPKEVVYVKLLTFDYVQSLDIGNKQSKVIGFSDKDILDVEHFINEVKTYRNTQDRYGSYAEANVRVDVGAIERELNRKKKHFDTFEHDNYILVYLRNNIRAYFSNFIFDEEKSYPMLLLKITDGIKKDETFISKRPEYDESLEEEIIQIEYSKNILTVNRSIQRTTASDEDVTNILYDIARLKNAILYYYSAGKPQYIIKGEHGGIRCPIWKLHAEEIHKRW